VESFTSHFSAVYINILAWIEMRGGGGVETFLFESEEKEMGEKSHIEICV